MTPRNVLIMGNSHTAAARVALRDDPGRWPVLKADVFAMPGGGIADLRLDGDSFLPKDDETRRQMEYWNGIPDLPIAGYDAFVVLGGLSFAQFTTLQDSHRSVDFPSVASGVPHKPVSTGLIDAMIAHRIDRTPVLALIRALAQLEQGPVLFMDNVLPSVECRHDPQHFAEHVAMAARGDGAALHTRYLHLLRQVLGVDAIHLAQPAHTVVDEVFTAPEWMRGSIRMQTRRDVPHEANEYGHANPCYGALQVDLMAQLLSRL